MLGFYLHSKKLLTLVTILLSIIVLIFPKSTKAAPTITGLSDNRSAYPNNQIPKYSKLEITFQLTHQASSVFIPFASSTPNGVPVGTGITVNAEFTPDNWTTIYTQPAFYFQNYDKSGSNWYYPSDKSWRVRFAPTKTGNWQFRITAEDKTGRTVGQSQSFSVSDSSAKGFIRVSARDPRYFEFENGSLFAGLGANTRPILNESQLQTYASHGVELLRPWFSQLTLWGSAWNPWQEYTSLGHYIPWSWLTYLKSYPGSDYSMEITTYNGSPRCLMTPFGIGNIAPGLKTNTNYKVRVRYFVERLGSKIDSTKPVGFALKTGGWLWDDSNENLRCYMPNVGTILSASYPGTGWNIIPDNQVSGWNIMETTWNSGSNSVLPRFTLTLQNTRDGHAYVDHVWIEEVKSDGSIGPNILPRPDMDHHQYPDQLNSFRVDEMVTNAEKHGVYLRPVILDKNDWAWGVIDYNGNFSGWGNENFFYGNYRTVTKNRFYLQAYWRYLQARWGYSPAIHSWELVNEGDPVNDRHWTITDELGKYMRQFRPNNHMVSTSFWHSFMKDFWGNTSGNYPNVDFADLHAYISTSFADTTTKNLMKYDAALYHKWHSEQLSYAGVHPRKPIVRGEAGLDDYNNQSDTSLGLNRDTGHIWLHNYLWAGLFHGGLYEQYWWLDQHASTNGVFDPNGRFTKYYNFLKTLPLNNGNYKDAEAAVGNSQIRAWGQKDTVNNRAHLWIQNSKHTWKNVVDNVSISPISTSVTISGFSANRSLKIEWWNTYTGAVSQTTNITTNGSGQLTLPISNLSTDVAVKIGDYASSLPTTTLVPSPTTAVTSTSTPSPTPIPLPGDINGDRVVNLQDYVLLSNAFGTNNTAADINRDGIVNLQDYVILSNNFGRTA